jgi:hypothetical protein
MYPTIVVDGSTESSSSGTELSADSGLTAYGLRTNSTADC